MRVKWATTSWTGKVKSWSKGIVCGFTKTHGYDFVIVLEDGAEQFTRISMELVYLESSKVDSPEER